MSHATADLEYFMCDMCHTYVHRDIYCPHRRECKGRDSKELKKDEVVAIRKELESSLSGTRCGGVGSVSAGGGRQSRFAAPVVDCGLKRTSDAGAATTSASAPPLVYKRRGVIEQLTTLGVRRELEAHAHIQSAFELAGVAKAPSSGQQPEADDDDDDDKDLEEFFFGKGQQ